MMNRLLSDRQAAALLLRWAAQLAAGENPDIISACRIGLRDAGYDLDQLAPQALALACTAQDVIGEPHVADERKAA